MPAMPNDDTPDDQLVENIAAGSEPSFVLLFRRRRDQVFRFAMHMTASKSAAEDITQEVFMVVMRDARRYDAARATVVAWLYGITRNLVRRRGSDRPLESLDEDRAAVESGTLAADSDPLADLAKAEEIAMLRRAVLSLPMRYREAVVLCDLQELGYSEAAQALGCAIGTVRSRLHRGRSLLAAKLREHGAESVKLRSRRCFA
jgi:RNA polymerase sigma-70 factor, ECF subfamily